MLSPRPEPLPISLVVKNGSKARLSVASSIPIPVSCTAIRMNSPAESPLGTLSVTPRLVIVIVRMPPSGIASRALIARFLIISSRGCLATPAAGAGGSELRVAFAQFGGACRVPWLGARVEPREFLFGPLAAGDIEGAADQPRQLAIRATAPLATGAKPMDLAVWPDDAIFAVIGGHIAIPHASHFGRRTIPVIGMDMRHRCLEGRRFVTGCQPPHREIFVGPNQRTGADVPIPSADLARLLGQPQPLFARLQRLLRPLALAVFLLKVSVEPGIFQRNCGLRGQQAQQNDPLRREGARRQIVLEIKHADERRLLDEGEAEHGSGAPPAHILVLREQVLGRSVVQDHALTCPDRVMEDGFGKLGGGDGLLPKSDLDPLASGRGLRLDPELTAPRKN